MKKVHNQKFNIIAMVLSVFFLFPFYWIVVSITKDHGQLLEGTFFPGIPNHFLDNLIGVFSYKNGVFFNWFRNSFLYAGTGTLVGTFFAALAGFAFTRYNFFGKKILFIMILGFSMVPGFATALPLFIVCKQFNLLNTYWSIIIPSMVNIFGVYLMVIYFNQIPEEIFDAAEIDGANDLYIFFRIGLPNILPGFTTLLLLSFVGIWNNYFLPLVMLSSSDKFPLILGIPTITSFQGFPVYNLIITGAFLATIPLLILFFMFQRFLAPQLTGAIK